MGAKIGIIGMGNVGSTLAYALVGSGLADHLVLIDQQNDKVLADKIDLEDSLANQSHSISITVNDYAALADADILVIAVGDIKAYFGDNPDRWVELVINRENMKAIAKQLKPMGFSGVIVVISNPCDAITTILQKELDYPKHKILGTGTLLDTSRLKRHLSAEMNLASDSIQGYVLGEHGDSQFVAWSGVSPRDLITRNEAEIEEAVRYGGQQVFNGKRYTNFAIARSTHLLLESILRDSHRILPVSIYSEVYDIYMSLPAIIGRKGVIGQAPLSLSENEKGALEASAQAIKQKAFGS